MEARAVLTVLVALLLPSALMALGEESATHPPHLEPGPWHPDRIPEGIQPPDDFQPPDGNNQPPAPPPDLNVPPPEEAEPPEPVCTNQTLLPARAYAGASVGRSDAFTAPAGTQEFLVVVALPDQALTVRVTVTSPSGTSNDVVNEQIVTQSGTVERRFTQPETGRWTLDAQSSGQIGDLTVTVTGVVCR